MRLDQRVAGEHGLSRRKAQDYIQTGRIDVDGRTCHEPGRIVDESARVLLDLDRPAVGAVRTRLVVLHEDDDLIIVDKPAGLLTLPTEAREKDTLLGRVNAYLLHRYRRRPYVGVVHRLDKETSGAIVFARSRDILRGLQELFRRHDVEREYVALVEGRVQKDAGTIGLELTRDRGDRRRGTARTGEKGKRAVTHYRVIQRMADATLLALRLETGRTHQIRVHLAALGHPVIGDPVYRPKHFAPPTIAARRQMLHARTLGIRHPRTGALIEKASEPPADFRELVARLGRSTGRREPLPPAPRPARSPRSPARDSWQNGGQGGAAKRTSRSGRPRRLKP